MTRTQKILCLTLPSVIMILLIYLGSLFFTWRRGDLEDWNPLSRLPAAEKIESIEFSDFTFAFDPLSEAEIAQFVENYNAAGVHFFGEEPEMDDVYGGGHHFDLVLSNGTRHTFSFFIGDAQGMPGSVREQFWVNVDGSTYRCEAPEFLKKIPRVPH